MAEQTITLTMLGPDDENGHVRLRDFLRQLERLQDSLTSIDRTLSHGEQTAYYRIVALSHSSPATVVLEPRPARDRSDTTGEVIARFAETMGSIERGLVPGDLEVGILRDLRDLAGAVGKGLGSASITVSDKVFELTPRFANTIKVALADVQGELGSIDGSVERFNVHNHANVFYLYPDVGPASVACHFPDELRERAKAAIMAWVTVTGVLKYLASAPFPHEITVSEIEIHEPEGELPDPSGLRGLAPDATGGQSSEDFIRDNRNAWG